MASRTPTYRPSRLSPRYSPYPGPLGSPIGPPTPNLQAQLSWMLRQPDIAAAPSPLFQQQQTRHVQSPGTPRSAFQFQRSPPLQQLQTPRSTPQPLTPRSTPQPPTPRANPFIIPETPRTPRSVRFDLPPQPQSQPPTPRSVPSAPSPDLEPPRQLKETKQRCTRCQNTLCIPPSASFITKTTHFQPVNMDRTHPRCVACDLTRTKELCKDVIAPAPSYIDRVQKIEKDLARMEGYLEEGVKVEDMKRGIVEARRRLGVERGRRRERLGRVWERFYGAWGPGVRAGQAKERKE